MKASPHSSVTRAELRAVPVPTVRPYSDSSESFSWEPIQHGALADKLCRALKKVRRELEWSWYVVRNGYGVIGCGVDPSRKWVNGRSYGWVVRHSNDGFWRLAAFPAAFFGENRADPALAFPDLCVTGSESDLAATCDAIAKQIKSSELADRLVEFRMMAARTRRNRDQCVAHIVDLARAGACPWRYAKLACDHLDKHVATYGVENANSAKHFDASFVLEAMAVGNASRSPIDRLEVAVKSTGLLFQQLGIH